MKRVRLVWLSGLAALVLAGCSSASSDEGGQVDLSSGSQAPSVSSTQSQQDESAEATSGNDESQSNSAGGQVTEEMMADDADPAALSECGLTNGSLAYMQRDWERVVDSIGREDHGEYAQAFLIELEALQDNGHDCPAGAALARFVEAAGDLADSGDDVPDYDLYRVAANSGNAWLDELGVTADRLAAG